MDSVHSEFIQPQALFNEFIKSNNKFEKRYESLLSSMNVFLEASKFEEKVHVDEFILGYALVDYFEDIRRLKEYHHVSHINAVKVVAYTAYWLLQRKPIQIVKPDKSLLYINERFILFYILDFLGNDKQESIIDCEKKGVLTFAETLFYNLKYRSPDADALEMMITAFCAGRIYQEEQTDISSEVGTFK